jgi:hypothetical protein
VERRKWKAGMEKVESWKGESLKGERRKTKGGRPKEEKSSSGL